MPVALSMSFAAFSPATAGRKPLAKAPSRASQNTKDRLFMIDLLLLDLSFSFKHERQSPSVPFR